MSTVFDIQTEAVRLLQADEGEEAVRLVRRERAASTSPEDVAFLSNLLGSVLSLTGLEDAALEEYEAAEQNMPDHAQWKLSTARHLLFALDRPAEAGRKAAEALRCATTQRHEIHLGLSLLGQAALALGKSDEALDALDRMISADLTSDFGHSSYDTHLPELLLKASGSIHPEVLARLEGYLHEIVQKAEARADASMAQKARDLLDMIRRRRT